MNVGDTLRLLVVAAQFDPTLLPKDDEGQAAKATAWNAALDVRMPSEWAQAQVVELFARDPDLVLTPAHLNRAWLATVNQPHEQGTRPRLPRPVPEVQPDTPALPPVGRSAPPTAEYQQARQRLAQAQQPAWWPERERAMRQPCPHCGALVGEVCHGPDGPLRKSPAHPARLTPTSSAPPSPEPQQVAYPPPF